MIVNNRPFWGVLRGALWRRYWPNAWLLRLSVVVILMVLLAPLFAVVGKTLLGEASGAFLSPAALFHYCWQTLCYVGGVVILSLLLALPAAWATVVFIFPGRRFVVWLLFLPFALPPYITAYSYADMMSAGGITLPGMLSAIVTTALAVYPYIYFFARSAFRQQHCHIQSAARLLGCSSLESFWRVSLPLARPAISVGVALATMEALNDIAVAEYFGVQTLGVGIYDLWLSRDDLVSAVRLAVFLVVTVLLLVWLEEYGRRQQKQYTAACDRCYECERASAISGWKRLLLWGWLLLLPVVGFMVPIGWLFSLAIQTPVELWQQPLQEGLVGSLWLSVSLVILLLIIGMLVVLDKRLNKTGGIVNMLSRLARLVYALPGTVLAQGIFILSGLVVFMQGALIGSLVLLVLACSSRFFVIAGGALQAGMERISPQLDAVAKLAAIKPWAACFLIYLPLLRTVIVTIAVMVFLEGIKELPMTLILRPFNFDTLATIVYQYASDEAIDLAAPSALVLAGLSTLAVSALFVLEGADSRGSR